MPLKKVIFELQQHWKTMAFEFHAFSLLPKHEQHLIFMKYCWRISVKELGELFGLGESAIKMKLKRIREKLIRNYIETDLEKLKLV